MIDGLEQAGFVVRTRDTNDRRKYRLSITQAGRAERRRTDELIEQTTDAVLSRLDAEQRQSLHRLALKSLGYDIPSR
jgi:DNA-binding MarR family transcriptional regulator